MLSGRVWKFGDNINTDLIIPGTVLRRSAAEQVKHVFAANRPGWVALVQPGDVLVAGRNFGMGSSRPAARALRNLKLGFLLAEEINGLFFRTCVNEGFLALECPGVAAAFEEGDTAALSLEHYTVVNSRTGVALRIAAVPERLLKIMLGGGIIPLLEAEGLIAREQQQAAS
jgi:3-isopropylmalate/(R)-2-methylmalate dehydratase small subunit